MSAGIVAAPPQYIPRVGRAMQSHFPAARNLSAIVLPRVSARRSSTATALGSRLNPYVVVAFDAARPDRGCFVGIGIGETAKVKFGQLRQVGNRNLKHADILLRELFQDVRLFLDAVNAHDQVALAHEEGRGLQPVVTPRNQDLPEIFGDLDATEAWI